MNQKQHSLMQVLQKISIFKGLELGHIQRLLKVGTSERYGIGETIYSIGEESSDMLVLLQGRLVVTSAAGDVLGEIKPGMPTGEMGVLTNQPGSANIAAVENSVVVVIGRDALVSVLASNQTLHIIILKNVVEILSERLLAANEQNDALQHQLTQLETDGDDDYTPSVTNDGQADEYDEYPGDEE
ncbi:MAG: cyclic nucleotide-binding domain-containing protein [Candidatus Latescibacteria bacterium]|nr:cyclic nucleotide-binding domain-containing protein [Candidatus Latescibacterota bacterium]